MDNIIERLSKFQNQANQTYKKFNPNPQPSYEDWVQRAPAMEEQYVKRPPEFPEYEDWKSQVESGTLPSVFQIGEEITPTEMPGETGLQEEAGYQFSVDDLANMIREGSLSTAEINLMRDLGLIGGMPEEEEEEAGEEEPVSFLSLAPEEARQKYEAGELTDEEWKSWKSYQKDIADLEKFAGEKPTPIAIMVAGKEQGFTMKDEYIEALMGELGWDYNEALNFYQSYIAQHPDYPRQ